MHRAFLTLVIVGTALALSACGGSSDKQSASSANRPAGAATGASGPSGPTGTSGTAGTRGSTRAPATGKKRKHGGGRLRTTPGTITSPSGTANAPSSKPGGKIPKKFKGLELNLYKQARLICRGFPVAQLASDYKAKSHKPADVARAYAKAYITGNRPRAREAVYEGCLASLRAKAH